MGTERRQLRGPLGRGVLAGVLYGAFQGFSEGSLLAGVISGLFFGAAMTVTFYSFRHAGEHLAGLSYRQRRAVMRAVRRGEPVSDPDLAGPTIRHAQRVQASVGGQRFGVVLARALLAVSVLALGLALLVRSTAGAAAAAFSLAVWTVILLVGPRLEQRKTANARAAEAAASRLPPLPKAT